MIRRINLFAGPGAGKSVVAAKLFAELKIKGFNIELVTEYIKTWAYKKIVPISYDQYYIFSKQTRAEDLFLSNGCDLIVTDSPLLMQLSYMKKYKKLPYESFFPIYRDYEIKYPSLNVFLNRSGIDYKQCGRYENEDEASQMDESIKNDLKEFSLDFYEFNSIDFNSILYFVAEKVKQC